MSRAHFGVYGANYFYQKEPVLTDVSFELEKGEILALLGPNGSGKSTLLKLAAGLLPLLFQYTQGSPPQVRLGGQNFYTLSPAARVRAVAYVPSELRAEFPLTAFETVQMGLTCQRFSLNPLSALDLSAVQRAMELCYCWNLREQDLHTLSGGERQLVALARAVAQESKVLFLDEALSKMDLNHQALIGAVLKNLANADRSIVLVSHDINVASEWAHTALLLRAGSKLAYGPIKSVLTEESIRTLYPGAALRVAPSPTTGTPKIFFA